jgi:transcriptional regulator with XRE-family HTH domain
MVMGFSEKLAAARTKRGLSQEQLAESMGVSRQAVSKWESGESLPDIDNLLKLSALLMVSIDRLLKEERGCAAEEYECLADINEDIKAFLCRAKRNGYAANAAEHPSSRPGSHDLRYEEGEYLYIDTYLGGENFSGEEAVWLGGKPVWAMNYTGRALNKNFSGEFLKESLMLVKEDFPYRGPLVHNSGEHCYHCTVSGSFEWFRGFEEIFCGGEKTYECYFHEGVVR